MVNLKMIRLALKFAKYAKNPDKRIREEILRTAPDEIKDKLNRIMDTYEKAKRDEIPRDEAIKMIASEIGFETSDEVIDMVKDLIDIMETEVKNYEAPEISSDIFSPSEKNISSKNGID